MSDNLNFKPDIIVLYCGKAVTPGTRITEGWLASETYRARHVQIPCSSKLEPLYIIKLFESGVDGVAIVVCPQQQCQCLFGSHGTAQRVAYVQRILEEVGIGSARLVIASNSNLSSDDIKLLACNLAASVGKLGPSRLKNPVPAKSSR
jgi:F420-non-reducing hydrogenase iron-sulfur subunit